MHAVTANSSPRLNLLGVQQGPGLGACAFLRWVGAGPRLDAAEGGADGSVWSTWAQPN